MCIDSNVALHQTADGDLVFHGVIRMSDVIRSNPQEWELGVIAEAGGSKASVSDQLYAMAALFNAMERTAGKHV